MAIEIKKPSEDIDFKTMVGELLDNAAGNYYEGWSDYWEQQEIHRDKFLKALDDWKAFCGAMEGTS